MRTSGPARGAAARAISTCGDRSRTVVAFALVKFGLMFANGGPFSEPGIAVGLAQLAEELGFESLWTVEHVVVPTGYQSTYPYSPTGRMPGGEDVPIPDPFIWLAYVAAATTRIRLATGHPDPAATQSGDPRQGDRDPRPALGRSGRARCRRRLARRGVRRARCAVRGTRQAHRRTHRGAPPVVARAGDRVRR